MRKSNTVTPFSGIISFLFFMALLTSCGSSKKINTNYLYFKNGADTVTSQQNEMIIRPNDLLSIQVYSGTLNQEQAAIFNIPLTGNNTHEGYEVSDSGNIEIPVIGKVKAAGLTKDQLEASLVNKLTDYIKKPSVIIKLLQFNVNVLGEVHNPGTQKFTVDRVTIIDALGAAGDLTDYGKRQDVTVIREENKKIIYHRIDLRDKNLFASPVYLLHQNDIVYVGANNVKLKAVNINPDRSRNVQLIFGGISLLSALSTLIITILK